MATPSLLSLNSMIGQILTVTRVAATTATTVYAVPTNDSVKIAGGALTNTSGSSVTVSLSVVPSGDTASAANQVVSGYPLPAGDTLSLKDYLGGTFLGDGDSISVTCSAAAALVVWLSGVVSSATNAGVGTSLTPTPVKTSAYTAVSSDLVRVSTVSGAVTVTLPAATAGTVIGIKLTAQASTNAVTVTPNGADTIDGAASLVISTLGDVRTLLGYAGGWIVANGLVGAGAPSATTSTQGLIKLAGDLSGTALLPTVPGKADLVATKVPTGQLGTGSASSSTFLRGDQSWATVAASSGLLTPTAVKTAAYTAASGDLVLCDPSAGGFTVTLPSAPADKTQIAVKIVIAPGLNTVAVAAGGTDKFNSAAGFTSLVLAILGHAVFLQYQASTGLWFTISDDLPLSQTDTRYVKSSAFNARSDGQENIPRWAAQGVVTMTSGFVRFAYFVANKADVITKISLTTGSTAAGATPTLVRYALYSVDASGNLTQLANIPSDTAIFSVASTAYSRTLNSSVTLTEGQLYAVAAIVVTAATVPTVQGAAFASGGDNAVSPRLTGIFTGQTDLLSSYTAVQVSQTVSAPYVAALR